MPLLRRKSVFAAKVESTIGTAETLTGAEGAFNAMDFMIQPTIAMTRREGQSGFHYLPSMPEGMTGTCSVKHELTYDGTNVPSWASVLLPACGWVAAGTVFTPRTEAPGGNVKTLTIGHYKDGKRTLLSGCMGTFTITLETGKTAFITFTFTGKYSSNETDTALIAPTYPTVLPLRFAVGVLTFNSVALCAASVSVDAGNSVVMRECISATDRSGYISALVTNRAPVITANPESVLVATQDLEALWVGSTPQALTITVGASGAGITIAAPQAQLENKQQGNRSDMLSDDLTWLASAGSAVDTELSITFD